MNKIKLKKEFETIKKSINNPGDKTAYDELSKSMIKLGYTRRAGNWYRSE